MLFYTHIVFALLVGLLTLDYFPVDNLIIFFTLLAIFSLLLDIDDANSKLGKKLGIFSKALNFIFGHRDFFHSFLFILPVYFVLIVFTRTTISLAFLLGTTSHLVMDALTPAGVRVFYPFKKRFGFMIKSGGLVEKLLFIILLILVVLKLSTGHFFF